MKRVFGLDLVVSLVFYPMVVASLYLLFAGHNQPGGGFVGGLVAGAAVALRYVGGGIDEVRRISPVKPWTMLGAGIVLASGCALVPIVLGRPVLETGYAAPDVPLLGTVSLSSALVFDLGVYFVVIGVVLMVVEAFGEPIEEEVDVDVDVVVDGGRAGGAGAGASAPAAPPGGGGPR